MDLVKFYNDEPVMLEHEEQDSFLCKAPNEILQNIFSFLDTKHILYLSATCKYLLKLIYDGRIVGITFDFLKYHEKYFLPASEEDNLCEDVIKKNSYSDDIIMNLTPEEMPRKRVRVATICGYRNLTFVPASPRRAIYKIIKNLIIKTDSSDYRMHFKKEIKNLALKSKTVNISGNYPCDAKFEGTKKIIISNFMHVESFDDSINTIIFHNVSLDKNVLKYSSSYIVPHGVTKIIGMPIRSSFVLQSMINVRTLEIVLFPCEVNNITLPNLIDLKIEVGTDNSVLHEPIVKLMAPNLKTFNLISPNFYRSKFHTAVIENIRNFSKLEELTIDVENYYKEIIKLNLMNLKKLKAEGISVITPRHVSIAEQEYVEDFGGLVETIDIRGCTHFHGIYPELRDLTLTIRSKTHDVFDFSESDKLENIKIKGIDQCLHQDKIILPMKKFQNMKLLAPQIIFGKYSTVNLKINDFCEPESGISCYDIFNTNITKLIIPSYDFLVIGKHKMEKGNINYHYIPHLRKFNIGK